VITAEGEQSVTLAWRTVPDRPPGRARARRARRADRQRRQRPLNVDLLLSGLLPDAESHGEQLVEGSYHALTGVARDDQSLAEVERLLHSVIAALKAGRFTAEDIAAIVLHREIREQMARESNAGRVAWIADAYLARRSWADHLKITEAMRRVTREDVLRVAGTYFGPDHVVILRRRGRHDPPKMPKPIITPVAIDPARTSPYAAAILAEAAPDPRARVAGRGPRLRPRRRARRSLIVAPNTAATCSR
jgi:hypothetical protein